MVSAGVAVEYVCSHSRTTGSAATPAQQSRRHASFSSGDFLSAHAASPEFGFPLSPSVMDVAAMRQSSDGCHGIR